MSKMVAKIALHDGDEKETIEKLMPLGWTQEQLGKFDEALSKRKEFWDISNNKNIKNADDFYKHLKKYINFEQFWCMK